MPVEVEFHLRGLPELAAELRALPAKLRERPIRNALAKGGRIVRDAAKGSVPLLREPDPRRKPGTVRDAIKVRTSKVSKAEGNVGVFINVKPLTAKQVRAYKVASGKGGAKNPNDPFYWRWLEFGRAERARLGASGKPRRVTRKVNGKTVVIVQGQRYRRTKPAVGAIEPVRFLQNAAKKLPEALRAFEQSLGPEVQRLNDKITSSPT